jgi:hypothetical protein
MVHLFILLILSVSVWTWTSQVEEEEGEDHLCGLLIFLIFYAFGLLLGHVQDQMYSQWVNSLDELKTQFTAETADVSIDMLQPVLQ